jgi:hypothetical protein
MKQLASIILGILVIAVHAQVPDYAPQPGVTAWYDLDVNGADASGNNNNGNVVATEGTADRFGTENAALLFDNSGVLIPTTENFDHANVTVSAWIKTTFLSGGYSTTFSHFIDAYYGYWLGILNGKACWYLASGSDVALQSDSDVNDDEWHMITGVYNNGHGKVYVDGVVENEIDFPMIVMACPTAIGNDFLGEAFYGSIDELAVWDRPLTDCEIQHLFSGEPLEIDASVSVAGNILTANNAVAEYQWVNCANFVSVAGATEQSFEPLENGSYAVHVTENGCTVVSECIEMTPLIVCEPDEVRFLIFPNPASEKITVIAPSTCTSLRILDQSGREVAVQPIRQFPADVNIEALSASSGYMVEFIDSSGKTLAVKRLQVK